jgi:hypothetical protein
MRRNQTRRSRGRPHDLAAAAEAQGHWSRCHYHRRLGDGAAVYRSADGSWTKDLAAAAVVTTAPARL